MRGDGAMIRTVLVVSALCGIAQSSVEHGAGVLPVFQAPAAAVPIPPPVVTSASSQYFERTFNRLVAPPVLPVAPPQQFIPIAPPQQVIPVVPQQTVIPVAPPPPLIPVASAPPVLVRPTPNAIPVTPTNQPIQPNVAIAIATAHAAPVATILLPPYPFGPPSTIGFIPPTPPINLPDESRKESTTKPTTLAEPKTTSQPEPTTPLPASSNTDNSFAQALPSNDNINFKVYGPPLPEWALQRKPQKLKTSVEVVPVPLAYIAPPPIPPFQPIKTVKHIHTFVPAKAKLIIRPVHRHVSAPIKIRKVHIPGRLVFRSPLIARVGIPESRPLTREIEPTTFRPSYRPKTNPPRV